MDVVIYGFGRMGLTHFAILNALNNKNNFTVIEPNRVVSRLLKSNVKCEVHVNDSDLKLPYDLSLITTPPFVHQELINKCVERGDKEFLLKNHSEGTSM